MSMKIRKDRGNQVWAKYDAAIKEFENSLAVFQGAEQLLRFLRLLVQVRCKRSSRKSENRDQWKCEKQNF